MSYVQTNSILPLVNTSTVAGITTFNLSAAESGKICLLYFNNGAAGGIDTRINLPAPADAVGCRLKFIVAGGTQLTTNDIVITTVSEAAVFRSVVSGNVTAAGGGGLVAKTALTLNAITGGATGPNIGDTIEAFSNGTFWLCASQVNLAGAIA